MISVYQLKPKFQQLLRPLTNGLAKAGVTANQVTVFAMLLSIATGAFIVWQQSLVWFYLLPAVLFVRMALNAIDGMLAREHNQKSKLGAYLNELGDVVSDTALFLPLFILPQVSPWLVGAFIFMAILVEFVGVMASMVGKQRQYQGPMGKSDRALVLGLLGIVLPLWPAMGSYINYVLMGAIALSVVTMINRIRAAL
ncbi:CDP-alcohol phosphatidyltransferase family protein [Kangiella geojedonensis]|uniref:CDP-alcohol phosphatidyltransferase n=1 Tax=Kangiella geojedonensis TaxID=914150 RepID=A0A0F6RBH2_9GAMM|nr:CDP-alcohol phosphatidyltransferase family protein [Kangiella geojedonensis]AKE51558.1 CDP-alcohol phosphatidyltransferase [Kangiella geojedonensis]